MQSPSEEKTRAALLFWAALSRNVPAVCTGPPCQEMAQIHAATKSQAAAWNSANSCQITKILTRLISVLSLSRKNPTWSLLLSNISCHIHDPQIRGHPQVLARQLKTVPMGWDYVWGGTCSGYLSTCAGCRSAGSLGLHAWWHPFSLLFQCLFLPFHLSLYHGKLGGGWLIKIFTL
jgi:hypothetical protein